MITLKDIYYDEKAIIEVQKMMNTEEDVKDVFQGKTSRAALSSYIYMIYKNNQKVGFVYLLDEHIDQNRNMLFVDMGIIKDYEHQGIGTQVLQELVNMDFEEFILGETKKNNTGANTATSRIGIQIAETEDRNFYLLQRNRLKEFIDSDGLEKLSKKFHTTTNKELIK